MARTRWEAVPSTPMAMDAALVCYAPAWKQRRKTCRLHVAHAACNLLLCCDVLLPVQLPSVLRCVDSLQLTNVLRRDHSLPLTTAMLCFLWATYRYAAPCSLFAT